MKIAQEPNYESCAVIPFCVAASETLHFSNTENGESGSHLFSKRRASHLQSFFPIYRFSVGDLAAT